MRGFVAELSDGSKIKEDSIFETLAHFVSEQGLGSERPWILLKKYVKHKNLKVVSLAIEYDHQGVFLPRNAKAYFFSRKVESFLGGPGTQKQYIGVGATERTHDEVEITWYDGEASTLEKRRVDAESDQFIVN